MKQSETELALLKKLDLALYFVRFDDRLRTLSLYIRTDYAEIVDQKLRTGSRYAEIAQKQYQQYYNEAPEVAGIRGINTCASQATLGKWTCLSFKFEKGLDERALPSGNLKDGIGHLLNATSKSLVSITTTLSMLFNMLEAYEAVTDRKYETDFPAQPYGLESYTQMTSKGFAIGGGLNGNFMKAIEQFHAKQTNNSKASDGILVAGAVQSIKKMIRFLTATRNPSMIGVVAGVYPDRFLVQANMGAAGLGIWPEERRTIYFIESGGVGMSGHNLDNPMDQILVLIGFARLSEEIILQEF